MKDGPGSPAVTDQTKNRQRSCFELIGSSSFQGQDLFLFPRLDGTEKVLPTDSSFVCRERKRQRLMVRVQKYQQGFAHYAPAFIVGFLKGIAR